MARRNPYLSCRRGALVEQMVVALARKSAPFDKEIGELVEAYDNDVEHEEWVNSIDFEEVPQHIKDIIDRPPMGQPVPPEPSWIKRLFSRGN